MPGRGARRAEKEGGLGTLLRPISERLSLGPWHFTNQDSKALCPLMDTETPVPVCSIQVCRGTAETQATYMDVLT